MPRLVALGDQALSGLSNFLAVALIARSATPVQFGHFAVAYALFVALLGLARQLWGTRISLTASPDDALRQATLLLGATVFAVPLAACVIVIPSLLLTGWESLPVIGALAAALPLVIGQDLCRYASVAAGRPWVAVTSDLVWVVAVAVGYAFRPHVEVALVIWLVGAALALLAALVALRLRPAVSQGWTALKSRHPTGEVSALGAMSTSLASYVTLGLATLTLSAAAAGSLRGASTVMAPVNTAFTFAGLAILPGLYRMPRAGRVGAALKLSLMLALLSLVWGVVLLSLPTHVGRLLLGATWQGARSVLVWTSLEYVGLALVSGATLGLQALMEARRLALVIIPATVVSVVFSAVAAVAGHSSQAYAQALAAGAFVSALFAWTLYLWRSRFARTDG